MVSGWHAASIAGDEAGRISTETLLQEIQRTRPLSVVMAEPMAALRAWAKERAVSAD